MSEEKAKEEITAAGYICFELPPDEAYPCRVEGVGSYWTWQGARADMKRQGLLK